MWHDVRQAMRTLTKHPGFAALASLVLALGIGLNTAIFSVVHAMLLKPPPVEAPHELVSIYVVTLRQPDRPFVIADRVATFFRTHNDSFVDVAMRWGLSRTLRTDGESSPVNVEHVSANYFDVLGVRPVLGRALLPAEDELSTTERALVISHALWMRRFGGDPAVIGRTVALTPWGEPDLLFTIVGVMPAGFNGISDPWKPTQAWTTFAQGLTGSWGARGFSGTAIARLKPGVSVEQARASVEAQSAQAGAGIFAPGVEPRYLVFRTTDVRVPNNPAAAAVPTRLAGAMTVVVAMVLLVAATNIAGILMARGVGRSGEIAVRRVLGAAPLRIVRQLLAEGLLLSFAGGVLGLVLAAWLLDMFRGFTPLQFALDVALEGRVVLFTTLVCVAAGLVVGVMPARQSLKLDVLPWLAGNGAGQTRQTRRRLRHAITLPQVAMSVVLLLVAGVYVRSLLAIELADPGYQTPNLVVVHPVLRVVPGERAIDPRAPDPQREERFAERTRRFYSGLLGRLQALPGAESVAIADALPLREPPDRPNWTIVPQETYLAGERDGYPTERTSVSPGYFRTMGIPLVAGRDFDERDSRSAPLVAVVSRSLAQRLWPGGEGIGRTLTILNAWGSNEQLRWFEVIGMAEDVLPVLHDASARPFVYFALSQEWRPSSAHVLVRGAGDSRALIPAVRSAVAGADGFADVSRVQTMSQAVAEILYLRRLAAAILAVSGAVALFLATIGIYGVVSYSVAQRTGEIGVRVALGAERRDIVRLVLREGLTVAAVGSAAGLALGHLAIRITSSRYLALPEADLATVLLMPTIIAAVVLLACYLPARRAGAVEPMDVLRRI